MKKTIIVASAFLFCNTLFSQTAGQKKILFDNTHAETSGSGDWCIDSDLQNMTWYAAGQTGSGGSYYHANPQQYPTPTQTAVTASTAETYWEGALSYIGIDCVNRGYWVETLPYTGHITYGTINTQDLSNYDILVVDEPNIIFSAAEKTALMNFIKNGGSLFMISDHTGSDRNNDGYDSPAIWNDFITNNGVQNNAFGFIYELQNFSDGNGTQTSGGNPNVSGVATDSIIKGPFGNVSRVKWSNGTCMTMNPTQNNKVKGHVWKNGKGQTDTAVVCVTTQYGCGKVAAIGDSSPPDDGTGNTAGGQITLYNGYTGDVGQNHRDWIMNMIIWLAAAEPACTAGINSITESNELNMYPNPANGKVEVNFTNNSENNVVLSLLNLNGQIVNAAQTHQKSNDKDVFVIDTAPLTAGIYYCKVQANDKMSIKKLVVIK
ncbi:MAG TPA: T9SS type A sorting domain-containing protein [Bacteroidia bacterium]|nr:T9SS type A sorting domain-containing protein [Bacteroidia bacterium]